MTVSLDAKIKAILNDVRIAGSDIQEGKLVDLAPLESRIKNVYHVVSDKTHRPLVADPGALNRHLTVLMDGLDYLEKMVTAKKEGVDPPTSSPETA
ncbi:MAG: hypothetical protein P8J29_04780 [Rhodospirillales bacterium]|nr:hypothetical protein [Rhodospirillales bacterium]